jgi:TPR repeat protein
MFYKKYLKYKNKYNQIKNIQKGGIEGSITCDNDIVFQSTIQTCWMIAIQTILVFGDKTKTDLFKKLRNISKKKNIYYINEIVCEKKFFIEKQIENIKNDVNLNNILPSYIFNEDKIDYLKNILNSFIDRYYNKIFNIRNSEENNGKLSADITNEEFKKGRCEILIVKNFKKLFIEHSKEISSGGNLAEQYLFFNILSIFLLNYKVSFINYYKDNYKDINYNNDFIGIIIHIDRHACCFFLCDCIEKYYNDTNKKTNNCNWKKLLKETDKDLYLIKNDVIALSKHEYENYSSYNELKKINYLTVITKNINSHLDKQINIFLNKKENDFNQISDSVLLFNIGVAYYDGFYGNNKNICKAIEYCQKSAELGYIKAMHILGKIYKNDFKNIKLAIEWYTKAALFGNKKCIKKLAIIYEIYDEFINIDKAFYWYSKLAKFNDNYALLFFARYYEDDVYVPKNYCNSIYWYKKLLKNYNNNDDGIKYKLGIFYYDLGNYAEALKWLKYAAVSNVDAQYKLGQIFEQGIDDYKEADYFDAIKWFKIATNNGKIEAFTNIGLLYEALITYYPDEKEEFTKLAFEYYNKGACLNDRNAQYYLGKMYEKSIHIEQNEYHANKWLKEAGKNGNNIASYELALSYFKNGNEKEGLEWFTRGAQNNDVNAQLKLGIYYYKKDFYEEAFEWLLKAAKQNNTDAQVIVGNMYDEGLGTDADITQALYWYKLAASNGNLDAKYILPIIDRSLRNKKMKKYMIKYLLKLDKL